MIQKCQRTYDIYQLIPIKILVKATFVKKLLLLFSPSTKFSKNLQNNDRFLQ